jgi:hypothetical protein
MLTLILDLAKSEQNKQIMPILLLILEECTMMLTAVSSTLEPLEMTQL